MDCCCCCWHCRPCSLPCRPWSLAQEGKQAPCALGLMDALGLDWRDHRPPCSHFFLQQQQVMQLQEQQQIARQQEILQRCGLLGGREGHPRGIGCGFQSHEKETHWEGRGSVIGTSGGTHQRMPGLRMGIGSALHTDRQPTEASARAHQACSPNGQACTLTKWARMHAHHMRKCALTIGAP